MLSFNTAVWVKARFTALHRWKDAPDEAAFLRDYHRHEFHVELGVKVNHDDRDVEFLKLKNDLQCLLLAVYHNETFDHSCEQVASQILTRYHDAGWDVAYCKVSEDGENGATVYAVKPLQVVVPFRPEEN